MVVDGESIGLSRSYHDHESYIIFNDNGSVIIGREGADEVWLDRLEKQSLLAALEADDD